MSRYRKIKITGCSGDSWYRNKIGTVFSILDIYRTLPSGRCYIIKNENVQAQYSSGVFVKDAVLLDRESKLKRILR